MNIIQAKSAASIPRSLNVSGRAGAVRALEHIKREIVAARKAGNDAHAAELSEAQSFFKRRARVNVCSTCGVVINPGATHCSAHQPRVKALPGTAPAKEKPSRRDGTVNGNDMFAALGFYATPTQAVFRRWSLKVGSGQAKRCFQAAWSATQNKRMELATLPRNWWPCACDFLTAITVLMQDKKSPQRWILATPIHVSDGEIGCPEWDEVAADIQKRGGPRFTVSCLKQTAKRLKLFFRPTRVTK